MGEEITYSRFIKTDYQQYQKRLQQETDILAEWFSNCSLSNKELVAGYELEAWLIDNNASPCPQNEAFLQHANNPYLFPELAKFNIEFGLRRIKQDQDVRARRPHHKNRHAGIVVRASRPHIADAGQVPFRSSISNFAGGSVDS